MAGRIGLSAPVMMTGGVAKNKGVVSALEDKLGYPIELSPRAQVTGVATRSPLKIPPIVESRARRTIAWTAIVTRPAAIAIDIASVALSSKPAWSARKQPTIRSDGLKI